MRKGWFSRTSLNQLFNHFKVWLGQSNYNNIHPTLGNFQSKRKVVLFRRSTVLKFHHMNILIKTHSNCGQLTKQTALKKLFFQCRVHFCIFLSLLVLLQGLLASSLGEWIVFVIDRLRFLPATKRQQVMCFEELLEWRCIDGDDRVLYQSLGTNQLVVWSVVDLQYKRTFMETEFQRKNLYSRHPECEFS